MGCVSALVWLTRLGFKTNVRDDRAFIAAAGWKIAGAPTMLCGTIPRLCTYLHPSWTPGAAFLTYVLVLPAGSICACLISFSNLALITAIPSVGVPVAQMLVVPDISFASCCRCRRRAI